MSVCVFEGPGRRSSFFFCVCVDVEIAVACRARAIGYRQHNREAVGGFFSQIGNLYMVHHLWGTLRSQHESSSGEQILIVSFQAC